MAIWSKGGDATNELVHAFTVGDDYRYDREIALYDILGSIAHAKMLGATGLIPDADSDALVSELQNLHREFNDNKWTVESTDEDVHSKVEALITERLGDPGKRLHTGRSRNDQVLTATRLYLKDRLLDLVEQTLDCAAAAIAKAQEHEFVPLPGYTHLQRGMPSSMGMFFGGHGLALLDNLHLIEAAWQMADRSPLGFGASYGVGLPLDRAMTGEALGFARSGGVAMTDANGRGKVECAALDAAGAVLNDLSRLAADIVFFTSQEAGFIALGAGFTTGSSIMPQKKNPDVFELLRGRAARFLGLRTGLYSVTLGLHSGYSRDLQDTKPALIDGLNLAIQALAVTGESIPGMAPVIDKIESALTPDLYATDEAYRLVREEGMTFRDAYVHVGKHLDSVPVGDHEKTLKGRTHLGSTGNLGLEHLANDITGQRQLWASRGQALHDSWSALLS